MINKLFRNFCFTLALLSIAISLVAQNDAKYSFNEEKGEISVIVSLDRTQLHKEDSIDKQIAAPMRLAILYPLDVNLFEKGKWITLQNSKKVYCLTINAPESHGIIVRYSDFYIPEGAKLYAYNPDNKNDSWVYTHEQNKQGGGYSTEVLSGDKIILEYVPSTTSTEKPRLHITEIGYKYRSLNEPFFTENKNSKSFNDPSNWCMMNVNCPEGDPWQRQKKGVMYLRIKKGNNLYACSGSLINNTNEDKTPYILSAFHCFFSENGQLEADVEATEFHFEYETAGCENEKVRPAVKIMKGADLLVATPIANSSDGVLLKLKDNIPSDWDVYYNGWDRENDGNKIKNGVVIHHPQGDVKKIAFYNTPLISDQWNDTSQAAKNTHWVVTYSEGVTNGGSSGSPIFNSSGLIVGSLTGGNSSCSKPSEADWYGKFWYHFDQSPNANLRMNKYLDPKNTNQTKLYGLMANGFSMNPSSLTVSLNNNTQSVILGGSGGYSVNVTDPNIASATLNGSTLMITGLNVGETTIIVTDQDKQEATLFVSIHKDLEISFDKTRNELIIRIYKQDDTIKQVRMIDLSGRTIYSNNNLNVTEHIINTSNLQQSVYILRVNSKVGLSKTMKIKW